MFGGCPEDMQKADADGTWVVRAVQVVYKRC